MGSNANEMPTFGDLTNVSVEKLQELETVLAAILALPLARDTYAQMIDGTPTRTPFSDEIKYAKRVNNCEARYWKKTIVSGNAKPSDQAMEQYEKIRMAFTPQDLRIDLKLAQKYQNAPPNSHEHVLRLLEMTAASVHAIAGMIYVSYHKDTNIRPPEPPVGQRQSFYRTDGFHVNFYHTDYKRFQEFPFGLLNVVGYWAEAELFGGVVLFEREESGSGITNAFIHPQKESQAFQLSQNQLTDFMNMGRAGRSATKVNDETVIPFNKEPDARIESTSTRVGEPPLRIYKNEYDKPPTSLWPKPQSCIIKRGDPRGAYIEEAIKMVKDRGWDKHHPNGLSLRAAFSPANASSSSPKEDPPSVNEKDL